MLCVLRRHVYCFIPYMKKVILLFSVLISLAASSQAQMTCADVLGVPLSSDPVFDFEPITQAYNGDLKQLRALGKWENSSFGMSYIGPVAKDEWPQYTARDLVNIFLISHIERGNFDAVTVLLESQYAELHDNKYSTQTPAEMAIRFEQPEILSLLLMSDKFDSKQAESLMAYANFKKNESATDILEAFLFIQERPLILAIWSDDVETFKTLLSQEGVDLSGQNGDLTTPMIEAFQSTNPYFKSELSNLQARIDVNVVIRGGQTVQDVITTKADELVYKFPIRK